MNNRRQRQRIACESCRERKRKCDGAHPCHFCDKYRYSCSYRTTPRTRRPQQVSLETYATRMLEAQTTRTAYPTIQVGRDGWQREQGLGVPQELGQEHCTNQASWQGRRDEHEPMQIQGRSQENLADRERSAIDQLQPSESNSGAVFARSLALALDPNDKSVPAMRMLAWNLYLGERQTRIAAVPGSLQTILSEPEARRLAAIYLRKVHPCYNFVHPASLHQSISDAWSSQDCCAMRDALLCGVGALACLFGGSESLAVELTLVATAKHLLDTAVANAPSPYCAIAWLLRTVYLRLTALPEETWLASCTTLHMVDAAGLHRRTNTDAFPLPQDFEDDQMGLKIFAVAQHLNMWVSYDLGRSRVLLQDTTRTRLLAQPGEYASELMDLLPYTENLDPFKRVPVGDLTTVLVEVLERSHSEPPSVLAQCNLMLCVYRRLHTSRSPISSGISLSVITLIKKAIQAVHSSIASGLPWHLVANIPFQAICTLLSIDTLGSFALLNDSWECLVTVDSTYQTAATRKARSAGYALLQLHRKRRETEIKKNSEMLLLYPSFRIPSEDINEEDNQEFPSLDFWWYNEFLADSDLNLP